MLLPARPEKPAGGIHLLHDITINTDLEVLRSTATDRGVSSCHVPRQPTVEKVPLPPRICSQEKTV